MGELEGKNALITGSSSGIGRGIASVFAREGADVIINYRKNAEGAGTVAEEIRKMGRKAELVQADVSSAMDVDRLFRAVTLTFGGLDILVNNAGIKDRCSFLQSDEPYFDWVIGTDLKGTYLCSRRAAELMKAAGGGKIINISSIHDVLTSHGFSIYAAAKGGVRQLTAGMAMDLADYGINVNAIAPGWVPVENEGEYPQKLYDAFCRSVPLGRPGTPEEVGELAAFLASRRADWITGQVIYLDGGTSCSINMPSRRKDPEIYGLDR